MLCNHCCHGTNWLLWLIGNLFVVPTPTGWGIFWQVESPRWFINWNNISRSILWLAPWFLYPLYIQAHQLLERASRVCICSMKEWIKEWKNEWMNNGLSGVLRAEYINIMLSLEHTLIWTHWLFGPISMGPIYNMHLPISTSPHPFPQLKHGMKKTCC